MIRSAIAISIAPALVIAVWAIQWFVTTPGRTTYGEFRLLTLVSIPALVTILSAAWIDNGRRSGE